MILVRALGPSNPRHFLHAMALPRCCGRGSGCGSSCGSGCCWSSWNGKAGVANAGNRWDSQESMCTKIINYESWTNDVTMEDVWCFMVLLWRNAPDESRVANCAGCSSIRPRLPLSSGQALEERKQAFFARTVCMSVCVFVAFWLWDVTSEWMRVASRAVYCRGASNKRRTPSRSWRRSMP